MYDSAKNFLWHFVKYNPYSVDLFYMYEQMCQIHKNVISIVNLEKRAHELGKRLDENKTSS